MEWRFQTSKDIAGRANPDVVVIMTGTNNVVTCLEGLDESIHYLSKNIETLFPDSLELKIVIRIRTIPKHDWTVEITNKNTLKTGKP